MSRREVGLALLVVVTVDAVVAIDQFAASIVRQLAPGQPAGSIAGFDIVRVDHAASGLWPLGVAFAIAGLPLTVALAGNVRATIGRLLVLGNALVIGGALSNGLSMLQFGVVSDFLVFRVPGIARVIASPADIAILVGYLVSCAALVGVIAFDGWGYAARSIRRYPRDPARVQRHSLENLAATHIQAKRQDAARLKRDRGHARSRRRGTASPSLRSGPERDPTARPGRTPASRTASGRGVGPGMRSLIAFTATGRHQRRHLVPNPRRLVAPEFPQ